MSLRILLPVIIICSLTACRDQNSSKSRGPIVLGDSSTIVTETDPAVLHDQVVDLQPVLATENSAEAASPAPDTAKAESAPPDNQTAAAQTAATPVQAVDGLNVPFKEVTLSIAGIRTKSYGKPDLQKARGASYQLTGGNLAGAQFRASGGTVTKVSQRYETVVRLQDGSDKLALESLGKYTSDWTPLSGRNGVYTIAGLEKSNLEFRDVSPSAIRNAVQQSARRSRLSRSETQEWLDAVRSIRSVDQSPSTIVLRSVMWRVEGKDAAGKSFNKELRIDVPQS